MTNLESCPRCGGDLESKRLTEVFHEGGNTAVVKVPAQRCLHCGERLYSMDAADSFDAIRARLRKGEFDGFEPVGRTFTVPEDWHGRKCGRAGEMMPSPRTVTVNAVWDDAAGVWSASSDDIRGLAIEAASREELVRRLEVVVSELWELNHSAKSSDALEH